jgi:uncharacterized membrane protein YgcG
VKRILAAALLCLGLSLGTAAPAYADVDDFTFASYDADYWLTRDAGGAAELRTVETFVAEFPDEDQNRGMIRAIPNDYDGVPLAVDVDSVVDENGDAVPFEVDVDRDFAEVSIGTDEYLRGDHTFTIEYTQRNVVRAFEDTNADELYWDTSGTGFAQPFRSLEARFHIDAALVDSLNGNTACYVGEEGSDDTCALSESVDDAGSVFTASTSDLGPEETVTVAIGFEAGTFVVPEPPQPAVWAWAVPIGIMILAGLLAILAVIVRLTGARDAAGRGTIVPEYSLPEGINLFEAGNLVGRASSALSATLVSLAVRGNVQIIDDSDGDDGKKDNDFSLRYLTDAGADQQETDLLKVLFGGKRKPGTVRDLTDVDSDRAAKLQKVAASTKPTMLSRGLRRTPPRGSGGALAVALAAVFIAAIATAIAVGSLSPATTASSFAAIPVTLVGVFIGVFCAYRPALLTEQGATLRDYVEGMRVYLKLAEKERFRMLQSPDGALRVDVGDQAQVVKVYEKLLPYAVLWGIEKEWAQELAIQYRGEQPVWYSGSRGYDPVLFAVAMNSFSSRATTAATPSYAGSGSGSFSGGSMGGGFSGGGGGGGGGGGR